MSGQINYPKSEDYMKQEYPDLVKRFEAKGISAKTAQILIQDEDITTMEALKHLSDDTIDALGISTTQKSVLKSVVLELKNPSVASQGGIEATNSSMTLGTVEGNAGLARVVNEGGAGGGAGIKLGKVEVKADCVGKGGNLTPLQVNNKGGKK